MLFLRGNRVFKSMICAALAIITALSLCACTPQLQESPDIPLSEQSPPPYSGDAPAENGAPTPQNGTDTAVYFIDVGQGDSTFICLPGGKCMLIDSGERDFAGRVISLIDCLGYRKIDHLVVTHPHTDHMGGMSLVVDHFDIGGVYMPDCVSSNVTFTDLMNSLSAKGLSVTIARAGAEVFDSGGLRAYFLAPATPDPENLNNCSAVLKLIHGERSFLFTGDAEAAEESEMVEKSYYALKSDVIKVPHHGSDTSSTEDFVAAVSPEIAVISCGENNPYGHPSAAVMTRWLKGGAGLLLRTDLRGTVCVSTDGIGLSVAESPVEYGYKWVLNLAAKKIHAPECEGASSILERNRACSSRTLSELEKLGYTRCGKCSPAE